MMTIDKAIAHAEWCAENSEGECSDEHRQLAEWLHELRRARMEIDLLRELLFSACMHMDARQMVIANSSDQRGCGRGCLEQLDGPRDAMCEVGIEVDG